MEKKERNYSRFPLKSEQYTLISANPPTIMMTVDTTISNVARIVSNIAVSRYGL